MKQKITGPALHRAASGVEVLDAGKRTFRISFSSDEPSAVVLVRRAVARNPRPRRGRSGHVAH